MKTNSYKVIKNFIHNDLGITKEYIDTIIRDTVNNEIHKILNDELRIKSIIENEIIRSCKKYNSDGTRRSFIVSTMDDIYNRIDSEIHKTVRERLIVKLRDSDEDNVR